MQLTKFRGINNVLNPERLDAGELVEAGNCDVLNDGQIVRRRGYVRDSAAPHHNLHEAPGGFLLATRAGDLVNVEADAALHAGLTDARVWYCALPDGRVVYSNGTAKGIVSADGSSRTDLGVPVPASVGSFTEIAGLLFPGRYRWQVTYVRTADGLEGGPAYSGVVQIDAGGFSLSDLPVLAGYSINVYLATHNGEAAYLAGSTSNELFGFTGANEGLVKPCMTDYCEPPPAGRLLTFWRTRLLVADGKVLRASRAHQWELFDPERDVKQFGAPITLVQPVDGGIFVGTERELAFLEGTQFDQLVYRRCLTGRVVLGSGVSIDGDQLQRGRGLSAGTAMVCIADGSIVAGYADGATARLTADRYSTDVVEVTATWRKVGQLSQYIAAPV